jgi:nascent polypeptide-associated complex subunit alpha
MFENAGDYMAKIPKNLRKSLQQGKGAGGRAGGMGGAGSRQMRRQMAQMGIDLQEVPAREVIIKCDEYDIIITDPQVSLINQAGQEIYQVFGTSEKVPTGEIPEGRVSELPLDLSMEIGEEISGGATPMSPQILPDDVKLVAAQAGVSEEEAEAALQRTGGNIAQAIIELRSNP